MGTTGGGLWKTDDMGISWRNVSDGFFKTGSVGAVAIAESDPNVVYVGMGEHAVRGVMTSPGDGVYKSTDAAKTWKKIGLELTQHISRIVIDPKNPNVVLIAAQGALYAPSQQRGIFKSTDGGATWKNVLFVNDKTGAAELSMDMTNPRILYAAMWEHGRLPWKVISGGPGSSLYKSTDGGDTWERMNDGGSAITFNGGKSWSTQLNMPTGQFYRINVDNQFPYRIYGGQQDNTSVSIASRELGSSGITNASWAPSAGGESAFLAFDPNDPKLVLGGSYQGTIEVLDVKAKGTTGIMAAPIQYLGMDARDIKYRFNWNAPIIWSQHEPATFYHGAQYLLKTSDWGKTWKEVSPELTRNEKEKQGRAGGPYTNEEVGAENYGTLSYIMESPREKGVIWTGSDDGLVYLTRDGGAKWTNVTPKGLAECLINAIEVSPHDKATAYIATTRYKFNDQTPGLYKTTDYGATWTRINNGLPENAFTRVVREDEVRQDLLFAGTELGLFVSWNGGKEWSPFQLNLPITPITDLRIYKGNLIAATSGRAYWILDNLSVLRQYQKDSPTLSIYRPDNAYLVNGSSELDELTEEFTGANRFRGVNPSTGVVIYYQLPELKKDDQISLEIKDADGNLVRTFSSKADEKYKKYDGAPKADPLLPKVKGLNRFGWDMRYPTMPGVPNVYMESSYAAHKAPPGKYSMTLKMGGQTVSTETEILANPLYPTDAATYREYHSTMSSMENELASMHRIVNDLYDKQKQLESLLTSLPAGDKYSAIKKDGEALLKKMKAWDEDMVQRKSKAYDDVENFPNKFTANYLFLINQTESAIPRVNQPSLDRMKELNGQWSTLKARANEILDKDIPALNKRMWDAGLGAIWKY